MTLKGTHSPGRRSGAVRGLVFSRVGPRRKLHTPPPAPATSGPAAVAHLAGALRKPTWTLLQHAPDCRWFLERLDFPWYPTMRLFRQRKQGDWPPVIQLAAAELRRLLSADGSPGGAAAR